MLREPNPNYKLTRYEQEVVINWSADDDEAQIYSLNPVMNRRMDKLSAEFPDVFRCTTRVSDGGEWMVPVKYISIRKPPTEGRIAASKRAAALNPYSFKNRRRPDRTTDTPSPSDDRLSTLPGEFLDTDGDNGGNHDR